MIRVETAASKHVPLLLGALSEVASGELKALYPEVSPHDLLVLAIEKAKEVDAFYYNDDLVCIVGITQHQIFGAGHPWMIPHSINIKKYKYEFLSASKKWIEAAVNEYGTLSNIVAATNTVALRWLKFAGFTFGEPFQINGKWFRPYSMEQK